MFPVMHRIAKELIPLPARWAVSVEFKMVLSRHFKANYLRRTIKANYKAINKIIEKSNVFGPCPHPR